MKILIVDDEEVLSLLTLVLKTYNVECEVKTATTGPEGVEVFQQGSFDVVIADTNVYPQYGLKVLEEVKKISPAVKTISLVRPNKNFEEIIELDYVDYALKKTFEIEEFVEVVRGLGGQSSIE